MIQPLPGESPRARRAFLAAALLVAACACTWPLGAQITCPVVKDNSIQAHPAETTLNSGGLMNVRIKDDQHYALLGFDCSAAVGVTLENARLYVLGSSAADFDVNRISTVAVDWGEGDGNGGSPVNGGSCFDYAFSPATEWAGPGSDFLDVAFGAGGSLVNSQTSFTVPTGEWGVVPLDLVLAQALVDGTQFGVVLGADPGDFANHEISARESGSGAYIVLNDPAAPLGRIRVNLDQAVVDPGQEVTGTVEVLDPPAGEFYFTIYRRDGYGRILDIATGMQTLPGDPPAPFSFQVRNPISMVEEIYATAITFPPLFVGEDAAEYAVTQSPDPWDDWHAIMWGGDAIADDRFWQGLRDTGVEHAIVYHAGPNHNPARHDFRWSDFLMLDKGIIELTDTYYQPLFDQFQASGRSDKTVFRRAPDLVSDANLSDWEANQLQPKADRDRPYRPIAYDLGDEIGMGRRVNPWDFDLSDAAVADFIAWLQARYPTIGDLNGRWGTAFADWSAIDPINANMYITTEEIRDREMTPSQDSFDWDENFSPWCDFKEYTDHTFAAALHRMCDYLQTQEPDIPCGFAGAQQPAAHSGYDYAKLMPGLTFLEPYDIGSSVAISRSFMDGRGPIIRTQFDGDRTGAYKLWYYLLNGESGIYIWWYQDWFEDFVEFVPSAYALSLTPTLKEFSSGVGRLLVGSDHQSDPVAILYSQPSLRVQWMWDSEADGTTWPRRFGSWDRDRNMLYLSWFGWRMALEDNGFTPEFISTQELLRDVLADGGFRLLVLPRITALSDEEAATIRAWVRSGGVVVADSQTGLFDERCTARPGSAGVLDDLFGITRDVRDIYEQDGTSQNPLFGLPEDAGVSEPHCDLLQDVGLPANSLHVVETGVRTGAAQALSLVAGDPNQPAILIRPDGAGYAIYLNLTLVPYPTDRMTPGAEVPMRTLVRNILACTGMSPEVQATNPTTGEAFPSLLRARFEDGSGNHYLGLVANTPFGTGNAWDWSDRDDAAQALAGVPGSEVPVRVRLRQPYDVYDVRAAAHLGRTDVFDTTFDIYTAGLYALLPSEITGVDLNAGADPDCVLTWSAEVFATGTVGRHVLRVEVFSPAGTPLPHYGGTVSCEDGTCNGTVPLALNDPVGEYRIRVTDIATGHTAEAAASCTRPEAPGPVEWLRVSGCADAVLAWTNPSDPDLAGVLWLRSEDVPPDTDPVRWTDYNVGETLGNALVVRKSPSGETGWTDTGLTPGVTYYYRAYAYDVTRIYSSPETVAFEAGTGLWDPFDLMVSRTMTDAVLSWSGPADPGCMEPALYEVHRATDASALPLPAPSWTVPGNQTTTSDPGVIGDENLYFYLLVPQP